MRRPRRGRSPFQSCCQRQAKKRVTNARIIFTTCVGAGLGLLRKQIFDTVIIDEASQQTEPASLIPLAKGCVKAILVVDHVQLRPTVQNLALSVNFDLSLFERLYTRAEETRGMAKVMLNTQYRMHPSICRFSSREFYDDKLLSGVVDEDRMLPLSSFPWPGVAPAYSRLVFGECAAREDLGGKSKVNQGQAELCVSICKLLLTTTTSNGDERPVETSTNKLKNIESSQSAVSIVVLTPYARQAQLLKKLLSSLTPTIEVSSVDGFQGREADVVVFVTVRCNESGDIGFLKDLRRMNVALTRTKLGLAVVGNKATLTRGREDEEEATGMWRRLIDSMRVVDIEST